MKKPIKALLLAAGEGTRLRPITLSVPKCLVKIDQKSLLQIWLEKLSKLGCKEVLINTHYLHEQVYEFLNKYKSESMNISVCHEEELLGTAGTLIKNINFFKNSLGLVIHADNITDDDLDHLVLKHIKNDNECILTMLTFKTETPETCGIVETNEIGILKAFHEKKDNPPGNIANGAIYSFDEDFLKFVKEIFPKPYDISKDIIPLLIGRIQTCYTNKKFMDIGNPKSLNQAKQFWKNKH